MQCWYLVWNWNVGHLVQKLLRTRDSISRAWEQAQGPSVGDPVACRGLASPVVTTPTLSSGACCVEVTGFPTWRQPIPQRFHVPLPKEILELLEQECRWENGPSGIFYSFCTWSGGWNTFLYLMLLFVWHVLHIPHEFCKYS